MIDRATVDKILDAVKIEEVIGDFVSLKRHGSNYLGLCPFHQDKNPSMSVSVTKGIFKCFACGKGGTAVSFIMDHEHLTYPEALRYLAKKYHIEIEEKEETPEEIANRKKYESLLVASEYAQKFYEDVLWNTEIGRAIGLSYFRERKFSDETIHKFGLGYAASRPLTFSSNALKAGYNKEYLVDSGLCIERDNGELADRFFDRVMFPIHSISGRVIAFGGRTLKSDKSVAKYVNSPETEIYVKRRNLYGLFQAKSSIQKLDKCILVEGYADVISMHQAGVTNVVASSGTSLTVEQTRLIKRFTSNVTIIYDGDEAGIKASLRGIDIFLEEGFNVKIVLLPPEDDPDSFAKAHNLIEIQEYIEENEKDFITYKSDILAKDAQGDPFRRTQVIRDIVQSISVIPDPILRNVYVEMVADRFEQKPDSIFQTISKLRQEKASRDRAYRRVQEQQPMPEQMEEPLEPVPDNQYQDLPEFGPMPQSPRYQMRDAYLAVPEREIVYYLIQFGEYILHDKENQIYGNEKREEGTVSQYIRQALEDDEIVMVNDIYRTIYEQYLAFADTLQQEESQEEKQKKVVRYFTTHEDQAITNEVLDLVCESHPLNVKKYEAAMPPEENALPTAVPKIILIYKLRITEEQCNLVAKQITAAQKADDGEHLTKLVKKLQMLNRIKNRFTKELKRL